MPKYNIVDRTGQQQEIDVEVNAYRAAGEAGVTLSQYLERKFPSAPGHGSTFEQCMQSAGLFLRNDGATGLRPPTMQEVLNGSVEFNSGPITRNDGSDNNSVTGRMLFPEIILQIIENELSESQEDFLGGYERMIAQTAFVTSPKVDQPIIDVSAPKDKEYRTQPIAQLAEPAALVTITLSEKSFRIPTKAIGIQISDQALEATTLDLVGLAMTQQARAERIRIVEGNLAAMISGDTDFSEAPIADVVTTTGLDPAGAVKLISQKAWIHFIRDNYRKMNISNIICDIDTALLIENRVGKPMIASQTAGDDPQSPRIDVLFSVENLGMTPPKILLVDPVISGANTLIGLDRRYAIRRVVNVNASYSAIEQYVMRRATSFRVDYGEMSQKLMPDAWRKMTINQS